MEKAWVDLKKFVARTVTEQQRKINGEGQGRSKEICSQELSQSSRER